jgi:predicted CXXCH cytochrome family protein
MKLYAEHDMDANSRQLRTRPRAFHALIGCAIGLILVVGCSVHQKYRTLSFFFDGVPDPDAQIASAASLQSSGTSNGTSVQKKQYQHKPYATGNCEACHTANKQLVTLSTELCIKCHANSPTQFAEMHVPVAIGECLWCHEPHESDSPRLLKTTATRLCLQCHDPVLLESTVKEHTLIKANCLECHTGHGGVKPSLLLADNPTVAKIPLPPDPTTQDSSSAADTTSGGGSP